MQRLRQAPVCMQRLRGHIRFCNPDQQPHPVSPPTHHPPHHPQPLHPTLSMAGRSVAAVL